MPLEYKLRRTGQDFTRTLKAQLSRYRQQNSEKLLIGDA
jgi:hypothetical protein